MPYASSRRFTTPLTRQFEHWLIHVLGRAHGTVEEYIRAVETFIGYIGDNLMVAEPITPPTRAPHTDYWWAEHDLDYASVEIETMEKFVLSYVGDGTMVPSASMRRKRVYALKNWYDFLEGRELADARKLRHLKAPPMQQRIPKPLPDDVWFKVWERANGIEERVWLGLGYYAGFRRQEIIDVTVERFNDRRVKNFLRKGSKYGDVLYGQILDYMPRKGLDDLAVIGYEWEHHLADLLSRRSGSELVISYGDDGHEKAANRINHRFTALTRGITEEGKHNTPHQLRHSFGTNCFRMGLPIEFVADQMSHTNIETTRGYIDTAQVWEAILA